MAIVCHWFGKKKRGLIMGIWNAHTSIGNITGSLIAAFVLKYGWDWSFIIPGFILALGGLLVFGFLVVDPHDVGLPSPKEIEAAHEGDEVNGAVNLSGVVSAEPESERTGLLAGDNKSSVESVKSGLAEEQVDLESQVVEYNQNVPELSRNEPAVGFLEAWRILSVATFAYCLFFSKLVAYTFLYWLPFYIRHIRTPHAQSHHTRIATEKQELESFTETTPALCSHKISHTILHAATLFYSQPYYFKRSHAILHIVVSTSVRTAIGILEIETTMIKEVNL